MEITLSSALILGAILAVAFLVFALYSFVNEERKRVAFLSKVLVSQGRGRRERRRAA